MKKYVVLGVSLILLTSFPVGNLEDGNGINGEIRIDEFQLNFTEPCRLEERITIPKDSVVSKASMNLSAMPYVLSKEFEDDYDDFLGGTIDANISIEDGDMKLNIGERQINIDSTADFSSGIMNNVSVINGTVFLKFDTLFNKNARVDDGGNAASVRQISPDISADSNGVAHVVWADNRLGNWLIYYSNSFNGTDFSKNIIVNNTNHTQTSPYIHVDKNDVVHVIWVEAWRNASGRFVQNVMYSKSTDGKNFTPAVRIYASNISRQTSPSLFTDSNGTVHVAFVMHVGNSAHIYYSKSENGTNFTIPVRVDDAPGQVTNRHPDLCVDSKGKIHVVWDDGRGGEHDIYYANSTNGTHFSKSMRIDRGPQNIYQMYPYIAVGPDDTIHVVWEDWRGGDWNIYYTNSNNSGASFRNPKMVNEPNSNEQGYPDIAVDSLGRVHIVWDDLRNDEDIYYTCSYDGGNTFVRPNIEVNDEQDDSWQQRPKIACGGNGTIHVVWQDYRNNPGVRGATDIYYSLGSQQFLTPGSIVSTPIDLSSEPIDIPSAGWDGETPPETTAVVELRASMDGTNWSDWEKLEKEDNDITTPSGRFLQWRILLSGNTSNTPYISRIWINYSGYISYGKFVSEVKDLENVEGVRIYINGTYNNETPLKISCSNDEGKTWKDCKIGEDVVFSDDGNKFMYVIELISMNLSATPVIKKVNVEYDIIRSYPENPKLYINNIEVWNYTGEFKGRKTFTDLSYEFSTSLQQLESDETGNVSIPIYVESSSPGIIKISDVVIITSQKPSSPQLLKPDNDIFINTTIPSFEIVSTDADNDSLKYRIEFTSDSFENPDLVYDQTLTNEGWSKSEYSSGEVAHLTLSIERCLCHGKEYMWRALAYDGYSWSDFSEVRKFKIDTTPPDGTVIDDGMITKSFTSLHAIFNISDDESGIVKFVYKIGTSPGKDDVYGPTETTEKEVTVRNLSLSIGMIYYFSVRAMNGAGLWSDWITSDGISPTIEGPIANISYPSGVTNNETIPIIKSAKDPNGKKIVDGDLEVMICAYRNGMITSKTEWLDVGLGDGGDLNVTEYKGKKGNLYYFRYRAKNELRVWGNYCIPDYGIRINREPVIKVPSSIEAYSGEEFKLTAAGSYDDDGDKLKYKWIIDGDIIEGIEVTYKYNKIGEYTATVEVSDPYITVSRTVVIVIKEKKEEKEDLTALLAISAGILAVLSVIIFSVIYMFRKKKEEPTEVVYTPPPKQVYIGTDTTATPIEAEEKPIKEEMETEKASSEEERTSEEEIPVIEGEKIEDDTKEKSIDDEKDEDMKETDEDESTDNEEKLKSIDEVLKKLQE